MTRADITRELDATPPTPHLAGWIAVAAVDAVIVAGHVAPYVRIQARALLHFYDAFQLVALGLAITGLAALYRRLRPRSPRLGYLAAAVLAGAAGALVLREDLSGPAERMPHAVPVAVWMFALPALAAQMVPVAALVGHLVAKPKVRLLGAAAGVAIAVIHQLQYPRSYEGLHLFAAATAATLIAASLHGEPLVARFTPAPRRLYLALIACAAALSAVSILVSPSNEVSRLLSSRPSVVIEPFLDRAPSAKRDKRAVPVDQRPWFTNRDTLPPVPPSRPALLPPKPIVLLIGIDSLRADVLADEGMRPRLPTLFALRDRAVYFTSARSAGSSTAPSMAAIFASKTYSQLYWTPVPGSHYVIPFPHTDPTPRFPELLAAAGVSTYTVDGSGWLLNQYGIVRGFSEQVTLAPRRRYAYSRMLVGRLIERLEGRLDQPFFGFVHLLDAHFPYEVFGKPSTPREGHLACLAGVDRQLARLVQRLEELGLAARTTLIIVSDHGEAFGEHGLHWHASSLYDELLRVPLLFVLPGGSARTVAERISLVDLGPTILDLMGVPSPGEYMGQSLTGFLRGERPTLHRPIVAEGRLKRAIVLPDGFKVIHDPRAGYVEIFDLGSDPREEASVYEERAPASRDRFGVLDAYFDANTFRRKGYKVPFRKW